MYYLNLREFDISPKQENMLLEKMYMMEWETIVSIVGAEKNELHSPSVGSPKHHRKASLAKVSSETVKSPPANLT